jgi:uncharacterized protein
VTAPLPTPVFIDTFMYVALLLPDDSYHVQAEEMAQLLEDNPMVTSEPVLVEVLNFLSKYGDYWRETATDFVELLKADPLVTIVPQTPELFTAGVQLYADRLDKNYSATDCMSMIVSQEHGILDIATNDHGFEQAGFKILFP